MKTLGDESVIRSQARVIKELRGSGELKEAEAIRDLDIGPCISVLAHPEYVTIKRSHEFMRQSFDDRVCLRVIAECEVKGAMIMTGRFNAIKEGIIQAKNNPVRTVSREVSPEVLVRPSIANFYEIEGFDRLIKNFTLFSVRFRQRANSDSCRDRTSVRLLMRGRRQSKNKGVTWPLSINVAAPMNVHQRRFSSFPE